MRAHVGLPDEIALRRSANGHLVAARSDPTAVSPALFDHHCSVNIVRKIGNSCKMYTCERVCSILRRND